MSHRSSNLDILLQTYALYEERTRGLQPLTLRGRQYLIRQFVRGVLGEDPIDLTHLQPADVVTFFTSVQHRFCPSTMRTLGTSLRSFFRYLRVEGLCDARLEAAIPTVARWKLAHLPRGLSDEQYERLIASLGAATPCGRRDRAVVLCLATLGLRPGEVAQLRLQDIDWRNGTLQVTTRKTGRGAVLPLPREAGRAIVEYLREERPPSRERRIFLRHDHDHRGDPITASIVSGAVVRALKRAGIDAPIIGAYVLRHTVATRLVRHGTRLKEIADFLGHRDLDTTTIYAKLDLPALHEVALPYPEASR
jgi:site-specific recombinase XerD